MNEQDLIEPGPIEPGPIEQGLIEQGLIEQGLIEQGLIEQARTAAGLTQAELARRAGTSRSTLSAYENGRKSPTLSTAERLLSEAGFECVLRRRVTYTELPGPRGSTYAVPDRLPRLAADAALRPVVLPVDLNWSQPGRRFRLLDRGERARVYEIVLREGRAPDIERHVDGTLLADVWDEMVLPSGLREAWQPLIDSVLGTEAG